MSWHFIQVVEAAHFTSQGTIMGYAGYVSAKLPPPKPTEVQAALWSIGSLDALELLIKLIQNIAVNPGKDLGLKHDRFA